jgi:hypothetical protein
MNQITEQSPLSKPQREFSQDFIIWLVALTIATLVLVFSIERLNLFSGALFHFYISNGIGLLFFPWVVAGGTTIGNALEIFSSGHVSALPDLSARLGLLLGVLFILVLGPTLLFFGWTKRAQEKIAETSPPMWRGSTIMFVIGLIITLSMAIPVIPSSIIQRMVSHDLRSAQAVQENKDLIIYEIGALVVKAHEYRVLPKELQGGGGSYSGFELPETLASTPNAAYTVTVADKSVTIVATSKPYPDATVTVQAVSYVLYPMGWSYTGSFE